MTRIIALCLLASTAFATDFGVNVNGQLDYDTTQMFADLIKSSRPFGQVASPYDQLCPSVDSNGWPNQDCGLLVTSVGNQVGNAGVYALAFTGNATVALVASSGWTISTACVYTAGSNTTNCNLTNDGTGAQLEITFVGQAGGVKNVSLIRPGHTLGVDVFNKKFIAAVKGFSPIRLMDATQTNSNTQVLWAERNTTSYSTSEGPMLRGTNVGMPWEYACRLSQDTGSDIWVNVPHLASDAYVTSMATLLLANCPTTNNIYFENGNEVWNLAAMSQAEDYFERAQCEVAPAWQASHAYTLFAQGSSSANMFATKGGHCYKVTTAGTSAGSGGPTGTGTGIVDGTVHWAYVFDPTTPGNVLNYDSDTNAYDIHMRYNALRAKQVAALIKAVYGSKFGNQARFVFTAQFANTTTATQGLEMIASQYGAPSTWFWATGGAPYFVSADSTENDASATAARYLEEYKGWLGSNLSQWQTWSNIATAYGIKVAQYEGGAGSQGSTSLTAKTTANHDSTMTAIVKQYINICRQYVDVSVWYFFVGADGSGGLWGLRNDLAVSTPKSQAFEFLNSTNPYRPRTNQVIPGLSFLYSTGGTFTDTTAIAMNAASSVKYVVTAPGAGQYKLVISYKTSVGTDTLSVDLNGVSGSQISLPNTSSVQTNLAPVPVVLNAGQNTIAVTVPTAGQPRIYSLTLTDQ